MNADAGAPPPAADQPLRAATAGEAARGALAAAPAVARGERARPALAGRARALAVLPLQPWPPDRGDRLRAWDMLEALAEAAELHVVLLGPGDTGPEARAALGRLARSLSTVRLSAGQMAAAAAAALARGLPPAVGAWWAGAGVRRVAALAAAVGGGAPGRVPWDVACAFQLRAAPHALAVDARVRVLELTDALSLYRRRLPWRGRALAQRLSLAGVARLERRLVRRFDCCFVSAAPDAAALERLAGAAPRVVPNGCHPAEAPAPLRPQGPLVFVGHMRYPPNEDAAVWFARQVWPGLRAAVPSLRLRLVGLPTPAVQALGGAEGIEVAGYVADVQAELERAFAAINPVRFGGGSSRKVLDAWALGRPVVSTRAGARGLGAIDGEHLLLADQPADWVRQVRRLREDPGLAQRVARQGWQLARREHDARRLWAAAWAETLRAAAQRAADSAMGAGVRGEAGER